MTERADDAPARALPCGHFGSDLVDVAADADGTQSDLAGAPPELAAHVADCPYCQAELARQRPAWQWVRAVAAEPVPTPPDLVGRVLDALRGVRGRPWSQSIELAGPDGTLTVAQPVVVAIARTLVREFADAHPDLWERGVELGEDGLAVRIAVGYGVDITAAADELRGHVRAGLLGHLGAAVPAVGVEVVDVVERWTGDQ
jgi:hypothetical protein